MPSALCSIIWSVCNFNKCLEIHICFCVQFLQCTVFDPEKYFYTQLFLRTHFACKILRMKITKFRERQSAKEDFPSTNYTMPINYQIKV